MAIDFKPQSTGINFTPSNTVKKPQPNQPTFQQAMMPSWMGAGIDIAKSTAKEVGKAGLGLAQAGTWAGSKLGIPGAEKATEFLGETYDKLDETDELKSQTLPQWLSDLAGFGLTFAVPSAGITKGGKAVQLALGGGKLAKAAKVGTVMAGEGALMGLTSKNEDRALMAGAGAIGGGLAEGVAPAASFLAKEASKASDALFNSTFLSKVSNSVKDSILRLTKMSPEDFTKIGKTGEMLSDDFVPSESVVKRMRGYMDLVGLEKGTEKEMGKSVQQILDTNSKAIDDYIYKSPAGNTKSPWTDLKQKYDTEAAQFIMENPGADAANKKAFDAMWDGIQKRMDATVGNPAKAKIKDSNAMKRWYQDVYDKLNPNDPDFNAKEKAAKFITDYMRNSEDTFSKGATREWNKKLQTGMIFKQIMNEQAKKSIGGALPTLFGRVIGGSLLGGATGHFGYGAAAGLVYSLDVLAKNKAFQAFTIDTLDKSAKFFGALAGKTDTEVISNAILGFVKDSPEKAAVINAVIKNSPDKTISGFEKYTKKALERFKKNPTAVTDEMMKEVDEVVKKKSVVPTEKPQTKQNKAESLKSTHNVKVKEVKSTAPEGFYNDFKEPGQTGLKVEPNTIKNIEIKGLENKIWSELEDLRIEANRKFREAEKLGNKNDFEKYKEEQDILEEAKKRIEQAEVKPKTLDEMKTALKNAKRFRMSYEKSAEYKKMETFNKKLYDEAMDSLWGETGETAPFAVSPSRAEIKAKFFDEVPSLDYINKNISETPAIKKYGEIIRIVKQINKKDQIYPQFTITFKDGTIRKDISIPKGF